MLNIFYGRASADREKFIFDRISGKTLILVPDQYTLEAEREAFRFLGVSALMDLEVLSPSRLGSRVLDRLGGSKRPFVDKYGRHMMLYRSARRQRENLKVFRGMEKKASFLEAVNDFISEMKQYNCGPGDVLDIAGKCEEGSYTQRKLLDMHALFSDYEEQIKGKYTDSEDYVDLYVSKLSRYEPIRESAVWVYGFDSFAPKAMAMLLQLALSAREMNLVMTCDYESRDRELFGLSMTIIDRLRVMVESAGAECRTERIPPEYEDEEKAAAIRHIERELYALPAAESGASDGLTMVEAAGIYNEAESAASFVQHLVRDRGLRYRDIRLICNDTDKRAAAIEKIFQEYGIQVFSDTKRNILSHSAVQAVISLLDVMIENYRSDCLMSFIKSGFGDLSADDTGSLENYGIKYKIKGTMWERPFTRGTGEYGEDGLAQIEELRRRATEPLLPLKRVFKAKTTGDFIKSFYEYLCRDLKMAEKIQDTADRQQKEGFSEMAEETAQVWNSIVAVLEQMYEIMGEEPFDGRDFRDIFTAGLSQVEIGLLPPSEDGLMAGTMQRSRSGKVRALVVIGANEGVLPQEKPSQGLFSTEEREMFASGGKELCKVDSVRFMEEKMAIYRNLSSPSEYLWISCSLADEKGEQIRPSAIFLKLREMFPGLEAERDAVTAADPMMLINSGVSGFRHLTENLREAGEGKAAPHEWTEALAWFAENRPEQTETLRRGLAFTNGQEAIGRTAAKALFGKGADGVLTVSPSRLEGFAGCPFAHLVTYGLRPEERRIFEANFREIGDLYHRCLMEVTKALTKEGVDVTADISPWMTVTREQCAELVEKKIEEISAEYRDGIFKDDAVDVYRGARAKDICKQVCWAVIEQVRAGNIRTIKAETTFGRHGTLPPIEVRLDDGSVLIEGIIDRVDYLSGGGIKVVDYKTTKNLGFNREETAAGYRLQLMLYLQAACGEDGREGRPAGVFYFKIAEPLIRKTGDSDDSIPTEEISKMFRLNGVVVNDPKIMADIAGGFESKTGVSVKPSDIMVSGPNRFMSEEDFAELQTAVAQKVKETCRDLAEGRIDVHPMKTRSDSACTNCRYGGICRFDTVFEDCEYNIVR